MGSGRSSAGQKQIPVHVPNPYATDEDGTGTDGKAPRWVAKGGEAQANVDLLGEPAHHQCRWKHDKQVDGKVSIKFWCCDGREALLGGGNDPLHTQYIARL